jgi:hypothetical protein
VAATVITTRRSRSHSAAAVLGTDAYQAVHGSLTTQFAEVKAQHDSAPRTDHAACTPVTAG